MSFDTTHLDAAGQVQFLEEADRPKLRTRPEIATPPIMEVGGFVDFWNTLYPEALPVAVAKSVYDQANRKIFPALEGYDALNEESFRGLEEYTTELMMAESPEEFSYLSRVFTERRDNYFKSMNSLAGFSGMMVGSLLNPDTFIPVIGAVKAGKMGTSLVKNALKTSAAWGIITAPEQAAIELLNPERPDEMSRDSILWSAALGAGVSGIVSLARYGPALKAYAKSLSDIERQLGKYAPTPRQDVPVDNLTGNPDFPKGAGPGSPAQHQHTGFVPAPAAIVGLNLVPDNPIKRVLNSASVTAQMTMSRLADVGFYLNRNMKAWRYIATPRSAWTNYKIRWIFPTILAKKKTEKLWMALRQRTGTASAKKPTWQKLKDVGNKTTGVRFDEFLRMVGKAKAGSGDLSALPAEAIQAAKIWDDLVYKPLAEAGEQTGMFKKAVYKPDYLNRIYLVGKIFKERDQFRAMLMRNGYTNGEAEATIEEILSGSQNPHIPGGGISQAAIQRSITIPDEQLAPWLEQNIFVAGDKYTRSMGVDIEIRRSVGDFNETLNSVSKEYDDMINAARAAHDPVGVAALEKQRIRVMKDLSIVHDQIRGTFGNPKDPTAFISRAARHTKNFNAMTQLTGGLIALLDIGTIVIAEGFSKTMGSGFLQMAKNMEAFRLAKQEAQLAGEAVELYLGMRQGGIADLVNDLGDVTWFENKMQQATNLAFVLNGMNWLTDTTKSIASMVVGSRISEAILKIDEAITRGWNVEELFQADMSKLARGGIGKAQIVQIATELRAHKIDFDNMIAPNTKLWGSDSAREAFRGALNKDINFAVITPQPGEKSVWMTTEFGSVLAQYKGYGVAAMQRIVMSNLQLPEKKLLAATAFSLGLGAIVHHMRSEQSDIENQSVGDYIKGAIHRSGILGYATDVNGIMETLTDNRFGLGALLGSDGTPTGFTTKLSAVFGPSVNSYENIYRVMTDALDGSWDQHSAKAARRLLYLNRTAHYDWLFDQMQKGMTP